MRYWVDCLPRIFSILNALQVPRKWGGSGSEKEEENLDFSAEAGQAANGASELAADMSKVSLVDRTDDEDTDSDLEGEQLLLSMCQ